MSLEEASRDLGEIGGNTQNGLDLLIYSGKEGEIILPSLDAKPLLHSLRKNELPSATIVVGVNSDSFNRGLGIVVEASPQINETEEHVDSYSYNGYGVQLNRNVIKFHPNMNQGDLRVEGPGGFPNQQMGFTPAGWSNSHHELHALEVTVSTNGINKILFKEANGVHTFEHIWRHKLFDGRDFPTVYGFIDLGGENGKPLIVGPVSLVV